MGLSEIDADLKGLAGIDSDLAKSAPVNAISTKGEVPLQQSWAERMGQRGVDRAKEIANFPMRVGRLVAGADKPQSFEDTALLALGNAPLIAATGGLSGAGAAAVNAPRAITAIAPALGRIAGAVGLAAGRGEDTGSAMMEGLGATTGELAGAAATKVLGTAAKGLEAIRERIGTGQSGPINLQLLDSLLKWWKAEPEGQMTRARRVITQLRAMDPSGESADIFKDSVVKGATVLGKHLPAVSPDFSEAARKVTTNPMVRAGVDAAMSADPTAGAVTGYTAQSVNPLHMAAKLLK